MIKEINEIKEIKESFALLDNSEKLEYLIELGKELGSFDDAHKLDKNKIKGCSSNVWYHYKKINNKFYFDFDSDTIIIKGVCFIIKIALSELSKEEILNYNFNELFDIFGLKEFSTNRQIGIQSIVNSIKNVVSKN